MTLFRLGRKEGRGGEGRTNVSESEWEMHREIKRDEEGKRE